MNRRISRLTFQDFEDVLEYAQDYHRQKDEPIPSLNNDSRAKIDSCLNAPFQTVFGVVAFKGLFKKAAALFYYIAKGHPLGNGNKRMACVTVSFFLFKNGWWIGIRNKELIDLARYTANSDPDNKDQCMNRIAYVLAKHSDKVNPKFLTK